MRVVAYNPNMLTVKAGPRMVPEPTTLEFPSTPAERESLYRSEAGCIAEQQTKEMSTLHEADVCERGPQGEDLRFSEDQPRDPDGKFASGSSAPGMTNRDVLFHGTSATFANYIIKQGLLPIGGGLYGKGSYAARSRTFAMGYAEDAANKAASDAHLTPEERADTRMAVVVVKDDALWQSQIDGMQLVARDVVPPENIVRVELYRLGDLEEKALGNYSEWKPSEVVFPPMSKKSGDEVVFAYGGVVAPREDSSLRFSPDQPRDPDGKFASGGGTSSPEKPDADGKWNPATTTHHAFEKYYNNQYPELKEGEKCDGRTVLEDVDNMSSIGASMSNYLILDGVREVDFSKFDMKPDITTRTKDLAEQIKQSGEIMPFIVGVDNKGPYIMEGSHRYDAMKILGAKTIPAIVVLDLDELKQDKSERSFRFNPDQPRDPDGKFASGNGEAPSSGVLKAMPEFLRPDMSTHEARSAMARNVARELGFPTGKVKTEEGAGREFKVGDRAFTEGGHAEIYTTGNIVIYTGNNSDDGIRGVVAHEIEHVRFEGVLQDYNEDMRRLSYYAQNDHEQYDKITDPVGFLDPEKGAGAVLPTATALQGTLELHIDQLAKDDGVSDYSKAYWDAVKSPESVAKYGGYKQSRERAIHETLAEMARTKFTKEPYPTGLKPTKLWRDLFSTVNKLAKEKKYGY